MPLHSFCHLFHSAVDGWVFDLEPVVSVPANQKPHILFPIQFLLIDLQLGCVKQVGLRNDLNERMKNEQKLHVSPLTLTYINHDQLDRPHKKRSWLPFRKTVPQWCAHLAAVGAEQELMIRTKKWMQQICKSQWISVVPLVFESATMHNTAVILVWTSSPISATFPSQQYAIPGYHGSSGGTPLILCTKTRAAHMAGLC